MARVLYTNRPGVGVSVEQVLGSTCYDLLPAHSHESFRSAHQRLFGEGEPASYEVQGASGRWYSCRLLPVPPDGGVPRAAISIAEDVTEQKESAERQQKLETRLQRAQSTESLAVLAGGVAHDFNNLLVGILGNVELALKHLGAEPQIRPFLQNAREAALCAAELTDRLLTYARRREPERAPVELNQVTAEMLQLLRATVSKKAAVELELEEHLPPIDADAAQVRQVIANLISNASEALENSPGTISVRTGLSSPDQIRLAGTVLADDLQAHTYAYLEVEDDGCGMDEALQSQIFDPFFSTKFTGRGLGLATCQGIVRTHGGALTLRSEPGAGSMFRAHFPCSARSPAPTEAPSARSSGPRSREGTILVVDDQDHVREVCSGVLETAGYRVLVATNGGEGLERFQANQVDLVLLDLLMPELDGREVFAELRRRDPRCRVILMSGYTEQIAASNIEGLAGFLRKPFRLQALLDVVDEALGGPAQSESQG